MTDPQVIVNLGTGGSDLNGQNGSTTSADSNDARFLDWPGDNAGNYVYLPAGGNRMEIPSEAAFNFTTDLDVRAYVSIDSFAATQTLISRQAATRVFRLDVTSGKVLALAWWPDGGATSRSANSTTALSVDVNEPVWVRATLDVDNGASQYDVKFFTSDDGSTWTQLGSTVTGSTGVTQLATGTVAVQIGAQFSTSSPATAKVYRAQVLDGIGGTTVLDVDTSVVSSGSATSFTALTSQTVSIVRTSSGRKAVAVVSPVWLFGTDDYMEVGDNALLDFGATDDFTVILAVRQWSNFATSRGLVTKRSATTGSEPGWLLRSGASNGALMVAGVSDASNLAQVQSSGALSSGVISLVSLRRDISADTIGVGVDGSFASATDTTTATSTNALPLRIGRLSGAGTNYADMEVVAVAIFRRLLSDAEVLQLQSYYQARLS